MTQEIVQRKESDQNPDTRDFTMDGSELVSYDGDSRWIRLPENTQSVRSRMAFPHTYRPDRDRSVIIFPPAIRHLSWDFLSELYDLYDLELPSGFLRRNGGDSAAAAMRSLKAGWEAENVTLGAAARVYLSQEPKMAAVAQALLQDADIEDAARLMVRILVARAKAGKGKRASRTALRRAVVFFIRHAKHISSKTARLLSAQLPGYSKGSLEYEGGTEGCTILQFIHVDYLLESVGVRPDHPVFASVTDEDGERRPPDQIKYIVASYLAESLNPAINETSDIRMPWVRLLEGPELASFGIRKQLPRVVDAILPDKPESAALFAPLMGHANMFHELLDMIMDTSGVDEITLLRLLSGLLHVPKKDMLALGDFFNRTELFTRSVASTLEADWEVFAAEPVADDADEVHISTGMRGAGSTIVLTADGNLRWGGRKSKSALGILRYMSMQRTADDHSSAALAGRMSSYWTFAVRYLMREFEEQYLEGAYRSAASVRRIVMDPVFGLIARGIIWEQDGRTFTTSGGGAVDAAGQTVEISDAPVRIAHVSDMEPAQVDAWVHHFDARKLTSWMGQIEEPDYSKIPIAADRFRGAPFKTLRMHRNGMMTSALDGSSGNLFVPDVGANMKYTFGRGLWEVIDIDIAADNYMSNRLLYQLDVLTMDERIAKDDVTLLPLLERLPIKTVRKALKTARASGSANLIAALENIVGARKSSKARKARKQRV